MTPITSLPGIGSGSAFDPSLAALQIEKSGPGIEIPARVDRAGATKGADPFGSMVDHFVSEVDGKMQAAGAEQRKVMSGDSTNLHQAMISMQEASVAFSLMVEVRNKLVDSYQEMMRMQV